MNETWCRHQLYLANISPLKPKMAMHPCPWCADKLPEPSKTNLEKLAYRLARKHEEVTGNEVIGQKLLDSYVGVAFEFFKGLMTEVRSEMIADAWAYHKELLRRLES